MQPSLLKTFSLQYFLFVLLFGQFQIVQGQIFKEKSTNIHGVNQGNIIFGDYDGDSDLDVFVFGGLDLGEYKSGLYKNDLGVFSQVYEGTFEDLVIGDSDWGDYDNDGDLDLIITGSIDASPLGGRTKIYENTGSGFSEVFKGQINGFISGAVEWGDFDGDGDLDIAIGGEEAASDSNNPRNFEIYENLGNEFKIVFELINNGIKSGSVNWGDYDNDGDLDILITGATSGTDSFRQSTIIDNLDNTFSLNTEIELIGVAQGTGTWGDFDNDGDLDILLNGDTYENNIYEHKTLIYQNNNSTFTLYSQDQLLGTHEGEAAWGDYDSDGDLDVLVIGRASDDFSDLHALIYTNEAGSFSKLEDLSVGVRIGSAAWGDIENDGDLDIIISGQDKDSNTITKIFENQNGSNSFEQNTPPSIPTNLQESINKSEIMLSWSASTDDQTKTEGLTYNIHLRSLTDTIIVSQSNIEGLRKVVKNGNAGYNLNFKINLSIGEYYWKVQAIDNSYQGSMFSEERMFEVDEILSTSNTPIPQEFLFFPNPASSKLVISPPTNSQPYNFTFYSLNGEKISLGENRTYYGPQSFDLSQLKAGVYLVKTTNNRFSKTYKVIKK